MTMNGDMSVLEALWMSTANLDNEPETYSLLESDQIKRLRLIKRQLDCAHMYSRHNNISTHLHTTVTYDEQCMCLYILCLLSFCQNHSFWKRMILNYKQILINISSRYFLLIFFLKSILVRIFVMI